MRQSKTDRTPLDDRIHLRPVTADDREFLLSVYAASREIELSMVPWDAAQRRLFVEHQSNAQTCHYETEYHDVKHDIILYDDDPAGRLFVSRGDPEQIAILDLTVMPEYRKKGIGSRLIRELQAEAARVGKSLRIYIENFNPSQELFRKLGFEVTDDSGVNLRFEWHNPAAANKN